MKFDDLLEMTTDLYTKTKYPIALTDAELNVKWANIEALSRFPGLSFINGVKDLIFAYNFENIIENLSNGKPFSSEPYNLSRLEIYPIIDSEALIGCHVYFTLDNSEGRFSNDNVQENIISAISNEFKMPLTIIFSSLGLMARYTENDETLKSYIKLITQNCYRLYRMSNHMFEAIRFTSGIAKLNLQKGDICSFIEGVCESASILTGAIGIPLDFVVPSEKIITSFDPSRLSSCLFNLISNACKFTREGNKIRVKLELLQCNVVISVSDSGIGMKENVIEHIFKPYFSFDPNGRPYGGSGLGLTIAKSIITLHGGTIAVESRENEGTRLAFTLPVKYEEDLPDYTAENSISYLSDRFSSLYIELSDICGSPMP